MSGANESGASSRARAEASLGAVDVREREVGARQIGPRVRVVGLAGDEGQQPVAPIGPLLASQRPERGRQRGHSESMLGMRTGTSAALVTDGIRMPLARKLIPIGARIVVTMAISTTAA